MEVKRLGRNDFCRCLSGKKFKKCCFVKKPFKAGLEPIPYYEPPLRDNPPPPAPNNRIPPVYAQKPKLRRRRKAVPPNGAERTDYFFVNGKGWTHERDLRPGDQLRQKDGSWFPVGPDRVTGTTHDHPYFVKGRGWVPADELRVGDEVRLPQWATVEAVIDTGRFETVYNFRVADTHTYFVGCEQWGFSVWAHNEYISGKTVADVVAELKAAGLTSDKAAIRIAEMGAAPGILGDQLLAKALVAIDTFKAAGLQGGMGRFVLDSIGTGTIQEILQQAAQTTNRGSRLNLDEFGDATLNKHFADVAAHERAATTAQQQTEAVGERAAAEYMRDTYTEFRMRQGFAPGTGFDQVWTHRTAQDIIVAEAKGPGAILETGAIKGDQMSTRWVRNTAVEWSRSSVPSEAAVGRLILAAMTPGSSQPVHGIVIRALAAGGAELLTVPGARRPGLHRY